MKLVSFTYLGRTRIGEIVGDKIYTVAWADSMHSLIRRGILPSRTYEHFELSKVTLEAPLKPGKIIAIGLNYADHAKETGKDAPDDPIIFAKLNSSVIGENQPITWHTSVTKSVDFEGELAVVIGKRATNVSEENALNYVFGYTIANDVTARDLQKIKDAQWTRAKGLDTFCPLGPALVTKDEIPDPQALTLKTTVGDDVMQDGSTKDMVKTIAQLIEYCSHSFTLEPGDVILTGTPSGVGFARKPQRFLKDGDTVSISIEGLGTLTNPCKVIDDADSR